MIRSDVRSRLERKKAHSLRFHSEKCRLCTMIGEPEQELGRIRVVESRERDAQGNKSNVVFRRPFDGDKRIKRALVRLGSIPRLAACRRLMQELVVEGSMEGERVQRKDPMQVIKVNGQRCEKKTDSLCLGAWEVKREPLDRVSRLS